MPQWIIDLFGEGVAQIVWVAIVAAIVCILAMAVIVIAKKAFGGSAAFSSRNRTPRLAVMDVARIDEKRRLVLVRRDEMEHLVMVGGQTDIVVESNILRVPAAAHARNHDRTREHDWAREPSVAAPPEPEERVAPASITPFPEPQSRPVPAERRQEPAAEHSAPAARLQEAPKPEARAPIASPPGRPAGNAQPRSDRSAAEAGEIVRKFVSRMPIGSGNARSSAERADAERREPAHPPEPPRLPEAPIQPRSRATPTLPPQRREQEETIQAPARAEEQEPARSSANGLPADAERIEPELPMPPLSAAPSAAPVAEDQPAERAQLRDAMNRAQNAENARVQDATVTAAALDRPNEPAPARKPLSVKSFAMAIQNRTAPQEMPQPPRGVPTSRQFAGAGAQGGETVPETKPRPAAVVRNPYASPLASPLARAAAPAAPAAAAAAAAAADAEPSLEDFLSAELDSDFGNDKYFSEQATREPPVTERPTLSDREPESAPDAPDRDASSAEAPASPASPDEPAAQADDPSAPPAEQPRAAVQDPIFKRGGQLTGSVEMAAPAAVPEPEQPQLEAGRADEPAADEAQRKSESAHSDWSSESAPVAETAPLADEEAAAAAPEEAAERAGDAAPTGSPSQEGSAPQADAALVEPETQAAAKEDASAEPVEVKSETAPAPTPTPSASERKPDSRRLTLEEEMERLLGDLSFATSSERQRR
ncbi:flagellar biosynthetic protein FliO [Aurantimonas sp. VKM B-3413]|uniref:flagellar biosynthetic protein FliO n=1 Tax=Aurantimonas sp. VKM B-3413 TaxID=2779401 RepID=UPI001E43D0B9|nr:flagellar biosynthetic protein FliO [Aurantimonas sp. VKM B-3413]MCB8838147.1 flagellar biosynthetic protein FliO [Aurantimonas sp. VKM B-3413]